jgi:hypothetical protein
MAVKLNWTRESQLIPMTVQETKQMKRAIMAALESFYKLLRFVFWYALSVAALFYLLPLVGVFVQDQYETMTQSAKFLSVLGFFCVVGVWQVLEMTDRWSGFSRNMSVGE